MMSHEAYCSLHQAIDRLETLRVMTKDMPFIICMVNRVYSNIKNALDSDKYQMTNITEDYEI